MKAVVGVALLGLTLSHNIKNPVQGENAEELLTLSGVLHAVEHPSPFAVPVSNYAASNAFIKIANVPAAFPHLVIDAASDSFMVNRQKILNDSENAEELLSLGGVLHTIEHNIAVPVGFVGGDAFLLEDGENAEELFSFGGALPNIANNCAVVPSAITDAAADSFSFNGENAEEKNFLGF